MQQQRQLCFCGNTASCNKAYKLGGRCKVKPLLRYIKMKDERKYWLWLSHACGVGSKCAVSLVRAFHSAKEVYKAKEKDLANCGVRIENKVLARLLRKDISEEESILKWCDDSGAQVIVPSDGVYPKSLLSLQDMPMVLYCLGSLPDFDNLFSCAVVGTRTMSEYGKKMACEIGAGLARAGACLISGLALGVDGAAMAAALEEGGVTVAVLGCGIDVIYPKQHQSLFEHVKHSGAILTEYAPGVSPNGCNFPIRNRIISGLSQGVCVIEGEMKSGALITARHGLYQGRDVYAVPGRVGDKNSDGANYLLTQGAVPVTKAIDIVSNYEFLYPHTLKVGRAAMTQLPVDVDGAVRRHQIAKRGQDRKAVWADGSAQQNAPRSEKTKKIRKAPILPPLEESEKPNSINMDALDAADLKIYEAMEPDVPMLPDEIARKGFPLQQVMTSMTMLEIAGAVEAGAGGYFLKRASDIISSREPNPDE